MSDTPESSINWERKFSFPVAVGPDEDDLITQNLSMGTYFPESGIKAAALNVEDLKMKYKVITGNSFLLPVYSNAANLEDAGLEEAAIRAGMDRLLPREAQFYSLDPNERFEKYFEKACVIKEHRDGLLLPTPYDPPLSLHINWPNSPIAINGSMPGSFNGIDEDGFAFGHHYMLKTDNSSEGELNPLLVRSMLSGLVKFERYRHFEKQGDGSITGKNQSNTGRLIIQDPDFLSLTQDDASSRVLKTISGICYEHLSASYVFSSPGIISSKPAIADYFKNIMLLHLTYFNNYKNFIETVNPASTTGKEEDIGRITGIMYVLVKAFLTQTLRTWAAYSIFLSETSEMHDIDTARLAILTSNEDMDEDTLASVLDDMVQTHSEGDTMSSWAYLLKFLEQIYVPRFLGCSWFELGADVDKLPAYNDDLSGWWLSDSNLWAGDQLNRLELSMGNQIPVFAGAPLGHPAKYYKKHINDNDDSNQLDTGTGLSVYDLEAIALSGNIADTGITSSVNTPSELYDYFTLGEFADLEIGYHLTLRPYKINSANSPVTLATVPYENFIEELLEIGGRGPAITITEAYENHPLISDSLAVLPEHSHVIARREDGETTNLESGSVLEVKLSIDYGLQESYIVNTVLAGLSKVYVQISMDNGSTAANYFQLLDETEKANYEESGFQQTNYAAGTLEMLKNGWNEDEQVEWFLVQNCFDYEKKFLVINNEEDQKANFYFWFFAPQESSLGTADLNFNIGLFYDMDNLLTYSPMEQLTNAFTNTESYPALFQEIPSDSLKFDIPSKDVFNASGDPKNDFDEEEEYLRQFIWGEGGDLTEPAHALYLKYKANLGTMATIQANATDKATAAGITVFPDSNAKVDWKMHEVGINTNTQNGLYNQLLPAKVHDRIRIVQNVYNRIYGELSDYGLDPVDALPIHAIMAIWGIESGLNLAPSIPMLRKGIPPAGHFPEEILIFGTFNTHIKDLIYCTDSTSAVGFTEGNYSSLSKEDITRLKADASGWYVLNLLSMDAYNGFNSDVLNEKHIGLQKHGFVKTVLHTRQQLGILTQEGNPMFSQDVDVIRKAYATWYQLIGNLSMCFGFVPQHVKKMGFGAAKDGTKLQELWVYEGAMHYSSCIRGPLLTGFSLQHDLPHCLAYVRFNGGESNFLFRLFKIIKLSYDFAVTDLELVPAGQIGSGVFSGDLDAFLTKLGTDHFGTIDTEAAAFVAPPDSVPDLVTGFVKDLIKERKKDNLEDSNGTLPTSFDLLEAKLLERSYDTADAYSYINTLLKGTNEQTMVSDLVNDPGDLHTVLTWMDGDPDHWKYLGEYFMTSEGATTVAVGMGATVFKSYETARWMQIKVEAFEEIFT